MATYNMNEIATRAVYGKHLALLGERDPRIVVLTADVMRSNNTGDFRAKFPDRFINTGIAEQNMMGIAAGLALEGYIPFACTFAPFASMRACEQVRTDICYPNLNVRVIGTHAGLTSGGGPTHYGVEDIGIMREFPNMTIICPGDPNQITKILDASITHQGPIYIRMGRGAEPTVYEEDYEYRIGKALIPREGGDAAIIACGAMVRQSIKAAKRLEEEGIHVRVVDMHTISPLDTEAILSAAKTSCVITVEEHLIVGGLGSAVAEVLCEAGAVCKFKRIGIPMLYPSYGKPSELYAAYRMNGDAIYETVKEML